MGEELFEAMHMAAAQKRITASQFTREAVQMQVDAIALAKAQSLAKVREMQFNDD